MADDSNDKPSDDGNIKPKRVFSQAMLDGQRAFTLKAHKKAGKELSADDATWLDGWITAHPPKPPKAKPAPTLVATPGGAGSPEEVEPDYPDPIGRPEGIKVAVEDKPKKGAPAKARWQDKYALAMEVELPDGRKLSLKGDSGRELVCVQGASFVLGLYSILEDLLALVGKKPLVPSAMMFGPAVMMVDKHLPQNLVPAPEHVVAFGFVSAGVAYGLNYKAIRKAQGTKAERDEHDRKVKELRERTRQREAEYQESERTKQVASEHAPQSAPPLRTPQEVEQAVRHEERDARELHERSVPDSTMGEHNDQGPLLAHDPSAGYREKPPGWNINAPVNLPDDVVI